MNDFNFSKFTVTQQQDGYGYFYLVDDDGVSYKLGNGTRHTRYFTKDELTEFLSDNLQDK